ncbi:MAG: DUF1926 domain-containing protein [Treponema sp.]|nr:DUF1926 domain-containing protein [Treponema sp.]
MSVKLSLMLGAGGHLPCGAGEAEFEAFYDREMKPLVRALDAFPSITMVFYYSGVILHWIERRHPEFFMLFEDLLSRKQAEFLGGGFYHPPLPLLPQADKIGQIEMLTTYLRKHFGRRPQGCWLHAWEQSLVGPLNSCGMNYTFLDDRQFQAAGAKPNQAGLFFPRVTEDQGKLITVFPVARALGRQLRDGSASRVLGEVLKKLPDGEWPVLVCPFGAEAGDAGTGEFSHERFLEELLGADPRIECTTPARAFKNLKHLERVYFPGAGAFPGSGDEIPPRQFLVEYPEAGGIYAKMVHVHTLINNQLRGDKTRKRTAMEELWKAQDSSVFRLGGAFSPGLLHSPVRKAAYRSLLEAENIIREKGKFTPSLSVFDFDLDGEGEYIFQDEKLNCCVKSRGAGVFELDYLPAAWNYLDTFSPPAEPGARGERRRAFVDWLAPPKTPAGSLGPHGIPGGRFCGGEEYEPFQTDRPRCRQSFRLPPRPGLPFGEIEIEKTWQLKKNALALEYVLKNSSSSGVSFVFCPQIDLSFPGEGEGFLRVLAQREGKKEGLVFDNAITAGNIRALEFQDIKNETLVALEASQTFDASLFHVRAEFCGRSEYQSTCVMPVFPISLDGGAARRIAFWLRINS